MSAMASQITGVSIVYSTLNRLLFRRISKKTSKFRVTGLFFFGGGGGGGFTDDRRIPRSKGGAVADVIWQHDILYLDQEHNN